MQTAGADGVARGCCPAGVSIMASVGQGLVSAPPDWEIDLVLPTGGACCGAVRECWLVPAVSELQLRLSVPAVLLFIQASVLWDAGAVLVCFLHMIPPRSKVCNFSSECNRAVHMGHFTSSAMCFTYIARGMCSSLHSSLCLQFFVFNKAVENQHACLVNAHKIHNIVLVPLIVMVAISLRLA